MAARVTQVVVEVLRDAVPKARITQIVVEVLRSVESKAVPDVIYHAGGAIVATGAGPIYYAD